MKDGLASNVVVVSPVPPPVHGAAVATAQLLAGMAKKGMAFRHVDARYAEDMGDLGGASLRKLFALVRYAVTMLRHAMFGRADAVILTPSWRYLPFLKDSILIWAGSFFGCGILIGWFHMRFGSIGYDRRWRLAQWYIRQTVLRLDYVVCLSPTLAAELPSFIRRDRVRIVPNGVEDCGKRGRLESESKRVKVLYLSNMSREKGWDVLLEVARNMVRFTPEVEFLFFGAPTRDTREEELHEVFAACCSRIRYMGFVEGEAKQDALSKADIFCLPSWNEAFPLVVLEAMASGLPIVASDVGGVRDAFLEGRGGYLVEAGNVVMLEEKLTTLVNDPELRARFGRSNRERYQERNTLERFHDAWCDCLTEVVEGSV